VAAGDERRVIALSVIDGIATIALDRPAARNALATWAWRPPPAVAARVPDEARVVVIASAAPGIFSAGADLRDLARLAHDVPARVAFRDAMRDGIEAVAALPMPTLAAVEGGCFGAAVALALACDLIVASPKASFGLVEKVVGLTPSMGGTQRLAERAGSGRARQFVMSGGIYPAAELERWGVVNEIYPEEEFEQRSRALAEELAAGPTKAHAKKFDEACNAAHKVVEVWLDKIRTEAAELFATEDLQNAVRTFLEHGGPGHARFEGR